LVFLRLALDSHEPDLVHHEALVVYGAIAALLLLVRPIDFH